ncbi:carbohydrate ABC transporter permease [Eisenbergiella tayi]|uniref:carbohydrate ABC transporter permease n=1 Tax=Eisenbergiella tayi TaxID=1432052 RepID=UPI000848D4F9|nr:sugar ABC transporter permease [Eisenbergiella tayi]ODR38935.1 ABC transporter permease [Eisenbergiella tayi]
MKKGISVIKRRNQVQGILFTLPAILGFLIFTLLPMAASLYLSFTDYRISNKPLLIGADNYVRLFSGEDYFFYKALGVTAYYVVLSVPTFLIVAFFIANLLNSEIKGMAIFRTIFYLPSIVPVVATSMIWAWLFNPDFGLFNSILKSLGLPQSQWIYNEKTVITSIVLMGIWTTGSTMVIFLAGLQDVPKQLYEAAKVDGAGYWKRMRFITIPLMTPTLFFNLIMGMINGFQVFSQAYIMTDGGPNNASLFYVFYLYREAFRNSQMARACACSWVLFIIIAVLTFITFRSSDKWVYSE